ncbi:MAG: serine hydrolase [Vulcanimicrobiaceae bacterium]
MRIWLTIMLAAALAAPVCAQEDTTLEGQLQAIAAAHRGKVALYALDVRSGRTVSLDADRPVPTASIIKLAVLFEALKQIQAGSVHFGDALRLQKDDQVEGSGVLQLFDTPTNLTLKDALTLMIVLSDNTATNLVIDRLGLRNIDQRILWIGLHDTWLYKKVFKPVTGAVPADQKQFGLGKTTAREMAQLMERFATCNLMAPGSQASATASDRKLCDVAIAMLKNQTDRDGIPRYLEATDTTVAPGDEITVANKTGALDAVRNDVAIVYARNGPVIISGFTYDNKDQSWTPDNAAQLLLAKLAKSIMAQWN